MNTRDDSMHVYIYIMGVLDYFGQSHMTSVTKRRRVIIDEARVTYYSVVLLLFADASSDLKRVVDRDIQRYSNCPIRPSALMTNRRLLLAMKLSTLDRHPRVNTKRETISSTVVSKGYVNFEPRLKAQNAFANRNSYT